MKLASYVANSKPAFGVVVGDGVATMNDRLGGRYASLRDVIAADALDELRRAAQGAQADQKLDILGQCLVSHNPNEERENSPIMAREENSHRPLIFASKTSH